MTADSKPAYGLKFSHNGKSGGLSALDRQLTDVLSRARSGDVEPLGLMLNDLRPLLKFVAWQTGRSFDDGEEIVQTVFLKFLEDFEAFEDRGFRQFKEFLGISVKNGLISRFRKTNRHEVSVNQVAEITIDENFEEAVIERTDKEPLIQAVRRGVSSLPSINQRKVIDYKYYRDYSYADIARELDSTPACVRVTHFRAIRELRKILQVEN